MKLNLISNITLCAALMAGSLSMQATAATACKGLGNTQCTQNNACGWVESYKRKDGREVNAFCRTSTKGRAVKKALPTPPVVPAQ